MPPATEQAERRKQRDASKEYKLAHSQKRSILDTAYLKKHARSCGEDPGRRRSDVDLAELWDNGMVQDGGKEKVGNKQL